MDLPSLPLDKRLFFSIRTSLILVTKFTDMKSLVKTLNLVESFSLNSGLIMAQGPRGREEECNLFLPFFYPPPFLLLATDWKDD